LGSYWVGFGFDWVRYILVQIWFFAVSPRSDRSWRLFLAVLKLGSYWVRLGSIGFVLVMSGEGPIVVSFY